MPLRPGGGMEDIKEGIAFGQGITNVSGSIVGTAPAFMPRRAGTVTAQRKEPGMGRVTAQEIMARAPRMGPATGQLPKNNQPDKDDRVKALSFESRVVGRLESDIPTSLDSINLKRRVDLLTS